MSSLSYLSIYLNKVNNVNNVNNINIISPFESAEKGTWNKAVEDLLQEIVDRGKNPAYQLINHCRTIAKARTIQAESLKNQEQNQQD